MTSAARRRADALIRCAQAAAPAERRQWVEAMRAEVAHLPDSAAASFALGCLWTSVRARAVSPAFILEAARWTLVVSALGWSGINLWLAGRLSALGAATPATVAYFGAAIYALGAVLTAALGLRVTAALVAPVLVMAAVVAARGEALLPHSRYNHFYEALALEASAMLVIALLIALGVPRWVAAREGGRR